MKYAGQILEIFDNKKRTTKKVRLSKYMQRVRPEDIDPYVCYGKCRTIRLKNILCVRPTFIPAVRDSRRRQGYALVVQGTNGGVFLELPKHIKGKCLVDMKELRK